MTLCSLNVFFIFAFFHDVVFQLSHGSEVIQPQTNLTNTLTIISCKLNAQGDKLKDVRLYKHYRGSREMLCQKGKRECKNVISQQIYSDKYLFVLLNLEREDKNVEFKCETTVEINGVHDTKEEEPSCTLTVSLNFECLSPSVQTGIKPTDICPSTPPPPPPHFNGLTWILIGLLVLMFLYSCIITCFCRRQMKSKKQIENSTYVIMKKPPC